MKKENNRSFITQSVLSIVCAITMFSCQVNEVGTEVSSSLTFFDTISNIPAKNPLTEEKILLGKKLFFDANLSSNKQVSCATCHISKNAFADGTALSPNGVTGKDQARNSPAIFNLVFHNTLFWDGGKETLENQALGPLRNEDEMNANLDSVEVYLNNQPDYIFLFDQAFNDRPSISNVMKAIASYERSLISFNSKFDLVESGLYSYNSQELEGKNIFENHCKSCHTPPLFTDLSFHNNGLDTTFGSYFDDPLNGRYRVTGRIDDLGKYKTPSLRNLKFTSPYMHDGRFKTLEEVLDHYKQPKKSSTQAKDIENGIHLTDSERENLIAFLNTLNDESFINEN